MTAVLDRVSGDRWFIATGNLLEGGEFYDGKKLLVLLVIALMFSACTSVGLVNGSIYIDVQGHLDVDPAPVRGNLVEGRATVQGILNFATGDCSLEAAIANALSKAPGSTRLQNITVDYHAKSSLVYMPDS